MSDIRSKDNDKSTKLSKSYVSERGRTKTGTYSEATCKNHGSVGTSSQGAHNRRKEITGHTRPSSCKEVEQTGLDGASVSRDDRKSKKRGRSQLESTPEVCCLKGDDSDDSDVCVIEISKDEFTSGDNNCGLVSPNLALRGPDQGWPSESSSFLQEGNDDDDTDSTYFERINEAEFKNLTQSNTMIIQKHPRSQDAEEDFNQRRNNKIENLPKKGGDGAPTQGKRSAGVESVVCGISEKEILSFFSQFHAAADDLVFLVPSDSDRANNPPSGYLTVFLPQIEAGWRAFVPQFFKEVAKMCGLCLSQLTPNVFSIIAGFEFACRSQGFPCTAERFFAIYEVSPGQAPFYYFTHRDTKFKVLTETVSSYGSWKASFFFVKPRDGSVEEWGVTSTWSDRPLSLDPYHCERVRNEMFSEEFFKRKFSVLKLLKSPKLFELCGLQKGVLSLCFPNLSLDEEFCTMMKKATEDKSGDKVPPKVQKGGRQTRSKTQYVQCMAFLSEGGEDIVSEEGTSCERNRTAEGNAVTNTSIGDDANAGEEFKQTMPKSPCSKGLRTEKGVKVLQSKDQSGARIKRREKVVSPTHTKDDCDHSVDHYHGKTDAGSSNIHDHDKTEKVAEANKTEDQDKRNRGSSKQNDFCRKLADSILERGPTHENYESSVVPKQTQANQNVYSLPLKFRFEDEVPEPVQKTDSELEVESLFAQFSSACEEMNSFNYCEVEQEREKSPVGETQDARCARGQHDFQYREDAGVICIHCHHEAVGPKDVMPEWAERTRREPKRKRSSRKEDFSQFEELRFPSPVNEFAAFDSNTGTVWDIKPGMRESMYKHQQEGFEFLWMNLAGSINLVDLKSCDPTTEGGGCIISHAPGTGKSRLTIVFIENYLKLFPHCRPVIVAPAGMLLTWEEEFKKWNVDFPFINLNSPCKENMTYVGLVGSKRHKKDGIRMMKIYSWNNGGSILGISYSLFEMLTGERHIKDKMNKGRRVIIDEKIAFFRQILLEKPGLVVLDEGHTPRNHKSNIWNALLKLQTAKRVILSGTPFQNNFAELFNTLRLVRPAIADELVQGKAFSGVITSKGSSSTRFSSSSESVNSVVEKLKSAISPFVHVHKGTILQESLPGLRDCVILLKPQALQKSLIEKLEGSTTTLRYEHQVALISMHPYLSKCLRPEEIQGLEIDLDAAEASKLNPNDGVKSKFILELVRLSLRMNEKVLIFSQFIPPLKLLMEQLRKVFTWNDGKEVLLMKGKLNQKKRQILINKFNDPLSEAKVMLASTKCCSEGISLIGASRVVLLDVVWNPSVEHQAISRAYRMGQKKFVYTYHLMTSGTSEADKYCKQVEKERLSELVFCSSSNESKERSTTVIEDRILEELVSHAKLKDMFEKIINQPKDTDLIRTFGLP